MPARAVGRLERPGAVGELVGHAVERTRDRRHFVAAVLGRARREIAGAEPLGRRLHVPEAASRRTEHEERDERHAHGEHADGDDRHRRPELAGDARQRRPGEDRDAPDQLPGDEDRRRLPRSIGRQRHRAGRVAPAGGRRDRRSSGAALTRRNIDARRFDLDRFAQLLRHLAVIRHGRGRRA